MYAASCVQGSSLELPGAALATSYHVVYTS